MSAPLLLRPATASDLPAVLRLYRELDPADAGDLAGAQAVFARMALYPDYSLHVAEAAGEVLGTFTLLVMENIAHHGSRSAVIEAVAVAAAAQGRGVGRAMMAEALRLAGEKGCYKASLSTRMTRERAHAFYESLGFTRHGFSYAIELDHAAGAGEAAGVASTAMPARPVPLRAGGAS
ncbi:GNAT family N-acetyltransferase [Ancylobacter lacus]|uniref:GNAT family N-acetyltransferase n=1 Tax=Ancylobacter lacus TaxID=2579970 RepID=UPI001BCC1D81|nr:GNAT family N-acetyltransferase [Ancylobacter lacus]MBS7537776.1 GNAT family N-acetyltransferase [Ancylobacter lacus]